MALIVFALGSLVIPTTLSYMATGVKSAAIQRRVTSELYAADAGVEYAMWRIHNTGQGQFSASIVVGGIPVNVTANSLNTMAFGPIVTSSGTQTYRVGVTSLVNLGGGVYSYTLTVTNEGTSTVHLNSFGAGVLGNYDYVKPSSYGVTSEDPAVTYVTKGVKLQWPASGTFSSSYKPARLSSGESTSQTFRFSGSGRLLGYYFYVDATPNSIGIIASDTSAYNIVSQANNTTIEANVANNNGMIFPVSWKIE